MKDYYKVRISDTLEIHNKTIDRKYLHTLKLEGVMSTTPKDHKKQINSNWDKELTYRSLFCSIVISPVTGFNFGGMVYLI